MRPTGREGGEQLACSGASRRDARIEDEPAPWKRGRSAKAPMSATSPPALSGSTPPSFLRRTAPSRATRRAAAWFCDSSSWSAAPSSARPRRLCCAASTSAVTRVAAACSASRASRPSLTASTSLASRPLLRPGISRSSPRSHARTRSLVPSQSETTTPPKRHSSRSTRPSSHGCSQQKAPRSRLYAAITVHGRARRTWLGRGVRGRGRRVSAEVG